MGKEKIAIAIEGSLLRQIDSLIDGTSLKSRSQAISYFVQKGLREQSVKKAVILLHKSHHKAALTKYKQQSYLSAQIDLFTKVGVSSILIVTQKSEDFDALQKEVRGKGAEVSFHCHETVGTGDSVFALQQELAHENFIVMSGDTFNDFDLLRMILRHFESGSLATIGLVNQEQIKDHGVVLLDGTHIIDFEEKPAQPKSHIVNAGIYIFRPEVFEFMDATTTSLEKEVFPKLAKIRQLHGYFTHGEYRHISE